MRNKKYIIGATVVLILILVAIAVVFLLPGGEKTATPAVPFADTSAERENFENVVPDTMDTAWITNTTNTGNTKAPRFRILSKKPVVGASTNVHPDGLLHARYTLRESANIYETPLARVSEPEVLSSGTILRAGDASWSNGGVVTLLRFFNETYERVFSYMQNLAPQGVSSSTTTTADSSTRTLSNNILSVAFSPDGTSLFYIVESEQGVEGYLESVASGNKAKVWSSPLKHVTASWTTEDAITVYTNPSLFTAGVVWTLDPVTWNTRVLLSNKKALSGVLSPDNARVLYSFYEDSVNVYTLRTMDLETQEITYMPLPTITEKCVWGRKYSKYVYCAVPRNISTVDFLERWYKGQLLADDVLWRFDAETGGLEQILDASEEVGMKFDMTDLVVDAEDRYLLLTKKDDQSLWVVELPQDIEIEAPRSEMLEEE